MRDVPLGEAGRFAVDGTELCVVHLPQPGEDAGPGVWYAIGDRCSHAEASLSEGEVWPEECEIECPRHGATFSLETGAPLSLPATKPVPTYPVRVDGDDVLVTLP